MKMRLLALAAGALLASTLSVQANEYRERAIAFVNKTVSDALKSPEVIAAIHAQNKKHANLTQDQIVALDKRWRAGDDGLIQATLNNKLSQYLAGIVKKNGGAYSEIFVMDNKGLNVGQSAKTSDYWQGDEAKWKKTFLAGAGSTHVSDVEEDESSQTFQIQVSLPIVDGGKPIGAITLGIDVEHLE